MRPGPDAATFDAALLAVLAVIEAKRRQGGLCHTSPYSSVPQNGGNLMDDDLAHVRDGEPDTLPGGWLYHRSNNLLMTPEGQILRLGPDASWAAAIADYYRQTLQDNSTIRQRGVICP